MIRDPSDGSVSKPVVAKSATAAKALLDTGTSGLPAGSTKSKDVLRLEASREWLKTYRRDNLVLLFFAIAMVPVWAWILIDSIGNLLR